MSITSLDMKMMRQEMMCTTQGIYVCLCDVESTLAAQTSKKENSLPAKASGSRNSHSLVSQPHFSGFIRISNSSTQVTPRWRHSRERFHLQLLQAVSFRPTGGGFPALGVEAHTAQVLLASHLWTWNAGTPYRSLVSGASSLQ